MTAPLDPTAGHLDLETLADLDEGLLDDAQAAAARAHLEGCGQCRDDLALLTSVREQLAADADAIVMPDDVATRLHQALAAEEPLATAATAETAETADDDYAPAAVTTLPDRGYARERRRTQWLAGLAGAAVIALFALGIAVVPHGSSSKESAGSAATSAAPAVATTTSGRDYTRTGLGSQALALVGVTVPSSAGATSAAAAASSAAAGSAAAPASGAAASSAAGGSSAAASSAPASAAASAAAGTSAASSAAAGGGKTPAAGGSDETAAGTSSSAAAAPSTDVLAPLRKPGAAEACLSSYDSQAGPPLAIDFATFDGKPAVIGVFRDPDQQGRYDVVAAGPPNCLLYEFVRPPAP